MPKHTLRKNDSLQFEDGPVGIFVRRGKSLADWGGYLTLPAEELAALLDRGTFDLSEYSQRLSGNAFIHEFEVASDGSPSTAVLNGSGALKIDGEDIEFVD